MDSWQSAVPREPVGSHNATTTRMLIIIHIEQVNPG